ncbi:MAG TPA: hypothetical protein VFP95_06205 [Gammaproteobacteria bacterium]|nr:hypothetical protein [Gammaproteobacteria bacterium]
MEQPTNHSLGHENFRGEYPHVHPARSILIAAGFVFASVLLIDLINNLGNILG